MDGSVLSPPAKRSAAANGGSFKRSKPPPPLTVAAGHILFRILCPLSLSGGVIGKSGTIVKQLQQDTGAKIRIEESPPGCDERVIVVIASSSVNKTIALKAPKQEEEEGGGGEEEVVEVSAAQIALIRVFERILEVAVETEGESVATGGAVACRLLAESSQVGGVIGRGGKVIGKIRQDTGCKVRVLSSEKLPACALSNDELVEIEGDVLNVKKALLTVSRRLQECPPVDRANMSGSRPMKAIPQEPFHSLHGDLPQRSSVIPPMPASSVNYAYGGHHMSTEAERFPTLASRTQLQEVVFRLLCSNDRVGGVIGKGGAIVNALQNETGASIKVGAPVVGCEERLITVTATENPESRYSPAQNAVILVFNRSIEAGIEKGLDSGPSNGSPVSARVVVPSSQIGCLLGTGGMIIAEMRKATGAGISIIGHDKVPKCASEQAEVVQITGEFVCVQDALYNVTGRLRDNLFPSRISNGAGTRSSSSVISETNPYERARDPSSFGSHTSVGMAYDINRHTTFTQSMDHLGYPYKYGRPQSPRSWASQTLGGVNPMSMMDVGRGLASVKGGLELGSGSRSAIVTNTTVEIVVPENVIGSVFGEHGSNLARLRQISGAKVVVHEPLPGSSERTVVISGTPDETQAAQSLLQAFILTGPS